MDIEKQWTETVVRLIDEGVPMVSKDPGSRGLLERAAVLFDLKVKHQKKNGLTDYHKILIRLLVNVGADWNAALDNPNISDLAKSVIAEQPVVRRALLASVAEPRIPTQMKRGSL